MVFVIRSLFFVKGFGRPFHRHTSGYVPRPLTEGRDGVIAQLLSLLIVVYRRFVLQVIIDIDLPCCLIRRVVVVV